VLSHSGIKIPYFTFFAHDSGKRPFEAPVHMRIAMIITAALCIGIGVFPEYLYALLPFEVDYKPYTVSHVLAQMQLLCFALLAFVFLMKSGLHPPEVRATNLDTDWLYRKFIPGKMPMISSTVVGLNTRARQVMLGFLAGVYFTIERPGAILARGWSVAAMMFIVLVAMTVILVLNLL